MMKWAWNEYLLTLYLAKNLLCRPGDRHDHQALNYKANTFHRGLSTWVQVATSIYIWRLSIWCNWRLQPIVKDFQQIKLTQKPFRKAARLDTSQVYVNKVTITTFQCSCTSIQHIGVRYMYDRFTFVVDLGLVMIREMANKEIKIRS